MTAQNNLELKGNLSESPLAKLLIEANSAKLDGSFRIADGERKSVIYLRGGKVVFAVSNAREHRLFEMLLQRGKFFKEQVAEIPNFAVDLEFGKHAVEKNFLSSAELDELIKLQVEEIVEKILPLRVGEWVFSPLVRIKDSINFQIYLRKILLRYSRKLSSETVIKQFHSFQETFALKEDFPADLELLPTESFVLSRLDNSFLKISEITAISGISEAETLKSLYTLWVSGFLQRGNYHPSFSERKIAAIMSARLQLKQSEIISANEQKIEPIAATINEETKTEPQKAEPEIPLTPEQEQKILEDYLQRVEDADTLYQVLGVSSKANIGEIKKNYFNLARKYHPDLFHRESGSQLHRRVQNAFTEIAHAYEILKDEKSRETYNFRNRKTIEDSESGFARPKVKNVSQETDPLKIAEQAFKEGYDFLMEEGFEQALPFLARAVQLQPNNARYRAFYGKLLANDETLRYKAEAELQQAVKLDGNSPEYRLMLAHFYVNHKLYRRAEGEIQRLLAVFPEHSEARTLLNDLKNK